MLKKMTIREIRSTFGRYIAIFAIIALGVGFFTGLRVSQQALVNSAAVYISEQQMFDFRLTSDIGFDDDDVKAIAAEDGVKAAAGSVYADFIISNSEINSSVMRIHSITEGVNDLKLASGRLPESPDECVVDAYVYPESIIGSYIEFTDENESESLDMMAYDRYLVVGTANSVYYINTERGTTSIGTGRIDGYAFIPADGFDTDYWMEVFVALDETGHIYTDTYNDAIDKADPWITELTEKRADIRYNKIYSEAVEEIADAEQDIAEGWEEYYDGKVDAEKELSDAAHDIRDARNELDEGWNEYYDGIDRLEKEVSESEQKLNDAESELREALETLKDAETEYAKGVSEYRKGVIEYNNGLKEFQKGVEQYESGLAEYMSGLAQYNDGLAELTASEKQLEESKKTLDAAKAALDAAKAEIDAGETAVNQLSSLYGTVSSISAGFSMSNEALISAIESGNGMLISMIDASLEPYGMNAVSLASSWRAAESQTGGSLSSEYISAASSQIESAKTEYQAGLAEYNSGLAQYNEGYAQISAAKNEMQAAWNELESARIQLEAAEAEIADAREELNAGHLELLNAEKQLADALEQINNGWDEYEKGLSELENGRNTLKEETEKAKQEIADAYRELQDGERKYSNGVREYNDAREEAFKELADAEQELRDADVELADAKKDIENLAYPDVYVLDRTTNIGYACYENDTGIIGEVATVFPIFFFIVSALVCITTMTRMVAEQRTQIGVLKALGFSNSAIMRKFMIYSGSASLLGCIFGFIICSIAFPIVLWGVYKMMYNFKELALVFNPVLAVVLTALFMFCALFSTWLACRAELAESPAELIRPKTPKSGKSVFLERIGFVWNRMNFFQKVSARNILRYKQRLIMMIIGICGCTALLLTGFGIYDSIRFIAEFQYDEISVYDSEIYLKDSPDSELDHALAQTDISEYIYLYETIADISSESSLKSETIIVYDAGSEIENFMDFHIGSKQSPLPKTGEVLINELLADRLGVSVGDKIEIRDGDYVLKDLTLSAVYENYIGNYVVLTSDTYDQFAGTSPEFNAAYTNFDESKNIDEIAADIISIEGISAISLSSDAKDRVSSTLDSLVYVVILVCVCAGALAFIVIYNLTNITINERIREIATIKVLGFTKWETAQYVFRENLVQTLFGAAFGLFVGKLLHNFVMTRIVVDSICFDVNIDFSSYIYSFLLTMFFAALVDVFMIPKLNKIDMAESLKSIE